MGRENKLPHTGPEDDSNPWRLRLERTSIAAENCLAAMLKQTLPMLGQISGASPAPAATGKSRGHVAAAKHDADL